MSIEYTQCQLCKMLTMTRGHHIIPRVKDGKVTIQICQTCEDFLHKTFSNNQLRDIYNSIESILADASFQKFLKWRKKQSATTLFITDRNKFRNKRKYS